MGLKLNGIESDDLAKIDGQALIVDGDAVVGEVISGKEFYAGSAVLQTGTMPTVAVSAGSDAYPAGYHAGDGGGLDAIDTDLASGNIKSGVTIFGKAGSYTGGALATDASAVGHTGDGSGALKFAGDGWVSMAASSETTVATAAPVCGVTEAYLVSTGNGDARFNSGITNRARWKHYLDGTLANTSAYWTNAWPRAAQMHWFVQAVKAITSTGTKTCTVKYENNGAVLSIGYGRVQNSVSALLVKKS